MLKKIRIDSLKSLIGNTPLHKMNFSSANLYGKLEYFNMMGSIKDRPAYFLINEAISSNLIDSETTVIESTSGNFGLALAGICNFIGVKFIPVIDPNITTEKENLLKMFSHKIIKVRDKDHTGGYLLSRIKTVKNFILENKNCFNPNQYENPGNYLAYYYSLAEEICSSFSQLDFAFISVSTGGTITGLSKRLKEKFKDIKIIGVDVEGSLVFNNETKPRKLSGIGASYRTAIIDKALIDDVVILSQSEIIQGCYDLLAEEGIFGGASSGAAYLACKKVLGKKCFINSNAVFICPDRGNAYIDNIYSKSWVKENILI